MKCALAAACLTLALCPPARAQLEPVEIVGRAGDTAAAPEATPAADGAPAISPATLLLIGASALVAGSAAGWFVWRRWSRLEETERAFLLLALRQGVRHKARQRLRAEATARGESPIARLLCHPD